MTTSESALAAPPGRVYGIADRRALGSTPIADAVEAMAWAGIRWIQVRAKGVAGGELESLLGQCLGRLRGSGAMLWLDDRADLAACLGLFGVHLGQRDLPIRPAREVVGSQLRLGLSTHDLEQVAQAVNEPEVDVIAVGPIFRTTSKDRADPVVGLELVRAARLGSGRPLVAIGGINPGNLRAVLDAGADAVAVIGALCHGDVERNARELLEAAA